TLDTFDFEPETACTTTCYVDGTNGDDSFGGDSPSSAKKPIQAAVNAVSSGGTVIVAAGTYHEDVTISKTLTLTGAGQDVTTISGPSGGGSATIQVGASGVVVSGFTITRDGNDSTTWNDPLNTAGLAVQGQGNTVSVSNSTFTGNRTAIDVNNSNGNSITQNVIDDNRTGIIFRNQTDNTTVENNSITNNWTLGIVFLDGSGGTNSPVQSAASSTLTDNDISGNWYGQVVDRQSGGSLPAPGTNPKNFSGNWYGTTTPSRTTSDSGEPGYSAQVPVEFGGTATPPASAPPEIEGPASANIDYTPFLWKGTDTSADAGFQGDYSELGVTADGGQVGMKGRIQEGVDDVDSGGTVHVATGTYGLSTLNADKIVTLKGAQAGNDAR